MESEERSLTWRPIFTTCYHIHGIMRTATESWWKADCTWPRAAHVVFLRSGGNPEVMAGLNSWDPHALRVLDYWKDTRALNGRRLHTSELYRTPSDVPHFS